MGLYFKDMEMVNSCRECPTMCDALIEYCNNGKRIPYDRRLDECPIVEITIPHGNLIDFNEIPWHNDSNTLIAYFNAVKNIPIWIEAEYE